MDETGFYKHFKQTIFLVWGLKLGKDKKTQRIQVQKITSRTDGGGTNEVIEFSWFLYVEFPKQS